jgi:hypothetical protein
MKGFYMIDIIVFSKDRACQLDALLRSIDIKFKIDHTIKVLYKDSNDNFKLGYDKVISDFKNVEFFQESSFRDNLFSILKTCKNKMISFFVDDIIMTETLNEIEFVERFYNDNNTLTISLRLGKNISICYAMNIPIAKPNLINNMWNWQQHAFRGDWGYSMSLDGDIYRKEEFVKYIPQIEFGNPCHMEAHMTNKPIGNKALMMCFDKSKLINIPINKTNDIPGNNNRLIKNVKTAEELNKLYLEGHRIKIENVFGINNNSCHYEVQLELT